jgi:hypothetical protein
VDDSLDCSNIKSSPKNIKTIKKTENVKQSTAKKPIKSGNSGMLTPRPKKIVFGAYDDDKKSVRSSPHGVTENEVT